MKVSIVINTYNRADYILDCLHSIERQDYKNYEVVIVNGPSTDDTEIVLKPFMSKIKYLRCDNRNLSESRNIGILNSSGDVVAFVDDDAVLHPKWVNRVALAYNNTNVGAVGGFTFDHTGYDYQCKYTVCNRHGEAFFFNNHEPSGYMPSTKNSFLFPSLLGTNSSFRRDILIDVGGFDENYAYMLDETDVCLRIHDKGFKI